MAGHLSLQPKHTLVLRPAYVDYRTETGKVRRDQKPGLPRFNPTQNLQVSGGDQESPGLGVVLIRLSNGFLASCQKTCDSKGDGKDEIDIKEDLIDPCQLTRTHSE